MWRCVGLLLWELFNWNLFVAYYNNSKHVKSGVYWVSFGIQTQHHTLTHSTQAVYYSTVQYTVYSIVWLKHDNTKSPQQFSSKYLKLSKIKTEHNFSSILFTVDLIQFTPTQSYCTRSILKCVNTNQYTCTVLSNIQYYHIVIWHIVCDTAMHLLLSYDITKPAKHNNISQYNSTVQYSRIRQSIKVWHPPIHNTADRTPTSRYLQEVSHTPPTLIQ